MDGLPNSMASKPTKSRTIFRKTIAKEVPCPRKVIDTKQIKANAIDLDGIAINKPGTARKVFSV